MPLVTITVQLHDLHIRWSPSVTAYPAWFLVRLLCLFYISLILFYISLIHSTGCRNICFVWTGSRLRVFGLCLLVCNFPSSMCIICDFVCSFQAFWWWKSSCDWHSGFDAAGRFRWLWPYGLIKVNIFHLIPPSNDFLWFWVVPQVERRFGNRRRDKKWSLL